MSAGGEVLDRLEELAWRDADAAHEQAVAFLSTVDRVRHPADAGRAALVRSDVESQRGLTESGARTMRRVNAWALENGHGYLQARSHRALSSLFRRVGDFALALEHAVRGVELLDVGERTAIRCDHLLALADALGECGSYEDARRRYEEANELAEQTGDAHIRLRVLNNWAYTEYEEGRVDEALQVVERLQAVADLHGLPLDVHDLDTTARVYMAVDRLDEARTTLLPLRADHGEHRPRVFDERANALLTLAEIERLQGFTEAAHETLEICRGLCETFELSGLQVRVRREQAELHAANGDYQAAFEDFRAFHEASSALHSLEREARARTLQVIFEASEARRDSAHYRELSVHDALTGLPNRRYLDQQLTGLCLAASESGEPLTVALVDLDHFKIVNDSLSHETGDFVLCRVADLLADQAARVEGGVAARLGGEEFVLILPGVDRSQAPSLLEGVRRAVGDHDWSDLTDGLPVTISIGTATAPHDGADRATLLTRCDERLYAAKHAGRNRVVTGDEPADVPRAVVLAT